MRICLFTPNFLPAIGGAERAADTIARGLIGRGHEVMVLCQRSGGAPDVPYPVRRYRRPPLQHLWPELLAWPLRRAHRAWRFDVVLAFYGYPTGYAATRAAGRLGVKVVISSRGGDMYRTFHGLKKPRVLSTIRTAYQRADRIIAVSQWIASRIQEVCANGGAPLPPIDTVPNGIDLQAHDRLRDQARATPPGALTSRLGGCRFALHLATLNPVKGHEIALQALHRLRERFTQQRLKYAIVGDGQSRQTIERRINELQLADVVLLLGSRTGVDKAWLLDHADFMVTTSREEGMPNVVIESMASGLPILASDIGPHRELIEGRGWGLLFRDGDGDDLAAKMDKMLNMDTNAMRQSAATLRDSYGIERMINGFEQACLNTFSSHTELP